MIEVMYIHPVLNGFILQISWPKEKKKSDIIIWQILKRIIKEKFKNAKYAKTRQIMVISSNASLRIAISFAISDVHWMSGLSEVQNTNKIKIYFISRTIIVYFLWSKNNEVNF